MVNQIIMIFLLIALCAGQQLTPIPSPRDGFVLGPTTPTNYTIDVFYDHLCSDSAAAFPGFYQYWQANQNWLSVRIHIYPLPSHQTLILNSYQYWDFPTVQNKVAQFTQAATGAPFLNVLNALNNDNINWSSRVSWKYATSRTITGTPMYLINQVLVGEACSFITASDWNQFFSNL